MPNTQLPEPELELTMLSKLMAMQARLAASMEAISGLLEVILLNLQLPEESRKNYCTPEVVVIVDVAEKASKAASEAIKGLAEEIND